MGFWTVALSLWAAGVLLATAYVIAWPRRLRAIEVAGRASNELPTKLAGPAGPARARAERARSLMRTQTAEITLGALLLVAWLVLSPLVADSQRLQAYGEPIAGSIKWTPANVQPTPSTGDFDRFAYPSASSRESLDALTF